MTNTDVVSVDRLVSVYIKIRDKKAAITAELKEQEAELNEKLDVIKGALLQHCKDNNSESVRTKFGTFFRTIRTKYWTSDWESMSGFIKENDAVDLLEKRLHQGNMRQFLDDNPDKLPPGLNVDSTYTITVRRSKAND
jgi:phage host-nuclease inhibitor protein Gam|tara:strand:- start:6512 stop:6925 length:414 start_codon:yes stop_codon:yes gene_type:complete